MRKIKISLLVLLFLFIFKLSYSAIPFTFTNGTTADATQVNSDFSYLENKFSTTSGHDHDGSDSKAITNGSSITSLGSITTGTWLATVIGTEYGGTGQDFSSATADEVMFFTSASATAGVVDTGKVNLVTMVTGTLPVANGGTGSTNTANTANGIAILDASGYLPDSSVDTTALKTTSGEVSQSGQQTTGVLTMPGGLYGFYPQTKMSGTDSTNWQAMIVGTEGGNVTGYTTYATNITLHAANVGGAILYAQQTYVTASGEDLWIFLLIDKNTKEIISAYSAPDHPAYGNGGDFEKLPHPFKNYDETKHEIVLVDNDTIAELKSKVTPEKSLLTLINEEYKPDMSKEEVYQPLHSGKFLGKKKEMVETIPDYIKVRKLSKLTDEDKLQRELENNQLKEKLAQDKLLEEQAKVALEKAERDNLKAEIKEEILLELNK